MSEFFLKLEVDTIRPLWPEAQGGLAQT
jgi:hypothetical protein